MKTLLAALMPLCLALFAAATPASDNDIPRGSKVAYDVHNGHFVKNTFKPKGDSAYLAFTSRDSFDRVFGTGAIMAKQKFVPQDAFDKKMVVAVIKRGHAVTRYKVEDVRADDKTLTVHYTTSSGQVNPNATFASPLIVSVKKAKYDTVVFIENGKKAEQIKVEK